MADVMDRRSALTLLAATATVPGLGGFVRPMQASGGPLEITWDDLIPPGIDYAEIIGDGDKDLINDTWNPVYDDNAFALNEMLNGAYIKMPGYIIPMDVSAEGVTEFMLVPYVGACIHVPPPPANQLVMVNAKKPWPGDQLWDAVWVTGTMRTQLQSTELGEIGYALSADDMEVYVW